MVGAGIAFVLYQGYRVTSSALSGWTIAPQSQIENPKTGTAAVAALEAVDQRKINRLAARASEIYERFAAEGQLPAQQVDDRWRVPDTVAEEIPPAPSFPLPSEPLPSTEVYVEALPPVEGTGSSSPVPVPTISQDERPTEEEQPQEISGDSLPQSGIGLTLGVVLAGAMTGGIMVRKKTKK
jgi:hypothetical protein